MIRVERQEEPPNFDKEVRARGNDYVAKHPGEKPPAYWNNCKGDLYRAYGGYCAYTTIRINGQSNSVVDHFLPQSRHPELRYEWSNYRLSSFYINSVKRDAEPIIDPFELPENAFHLAEDMSIEVNPEAFANEEAVALAQDTLRRLKLNSPEWLADREGFLEEALKLQQEGKTRDKTNDLHISRQLYGLSRFLHQEAVRMGYVKPI